LDWEECFKQVAALLTSAKLLVDAESSCAGAWFVRAWFVQST
jgi:hypothetical protein